MTPPPKAACCAGTSFKPHHESTILAITQQTTKKAMQGASIPMRRHNPGFLKQSGEPSQSLILIMNSSFACFWITPRLPRFEILPPCEIRPVTMNAVMEWRWGASSIFRAI
eukprot:3682693-Pleurochrysis_carterae.AAC.2